MAFFRVVPTNCRCFTARQASSMTRFIRSLLFAATMALAARAEPVISEFMADNQATLPDEDGAFSDWIEIHNPTAAPLSLAGWKLTDNPASPGKWSFPVLTLAPGGFRIFFASEKHATYPHHTNFKLAKGGEYLALVRPDGSIRQQFAPAFPAQAADESYGPRFDHNTLIAVGAAARYQVPGAAIAGWEAPGFDHAAWALGTTGLGCGLTAPGINIRQVFKNGAMGGLTDALSLLALPAGDSGILAQTTAVAATLNCLGEGDDGHYAFNSPTPGGDGDHYAIEATGFIQIPTAGYHTFGINSADGGSITIGGSAVVTDDSFHGPTDSLGSIYLTAGSHPFRVVMFAGGGGGEVEFFAAAGQFPVWDSTNFRLVGDTANGGLAATTAEAGSGSLIGTDLGAALDGRTTCYARLPFAASGPGAATALSLVTRHNDGFAAWLNGQPAASHNAPATPLWNSAATASRGSADSLRRSGWNLTSLLPSLADGSNLLAIQGLRSSTSDPSFLMLPELIIGRYNAELAPAFFGQGLATPGWINGPSSSLGKVADIRFSVSRGIFTAPFQLAISTDTPGATIRYTIDGSEPTATTGSVYATPLTIAATTNLRAAAFLTDWQPAAVATQTYLFPADIIRQQPAGTPPPGWPAGSGSSQVLDFGMDPDIVNHSNPDLGGPATVTNALLALPSVVLTTALPNYFNIDGSQGFYANPYGRGFAWERPVSVEWINPPDASHPNGSSEFQVNAGVRLRGGYSRHYSNPKHAFHLFFREDYGAAKLAYPLFGRHGAREFDRIDLRTAQNYSWSFQGDARNTFVREEACRQAQLDMGQPGSRVRYIHLYLNGVYWGLFNLDERTEAAFSASYFGGDKEDYDVVKSEQYSGYTTGATDGSLAAWQNLWNLSRAHAANPTNANYFKMLGKAADGVTRTADPVLLDPDNLIDYLMLTFDTGNLDGCVSSFHGNDRANNWFGSRRALDNPGEGFRFYVHDFEHVFFSRWEDRTGPWEPSNQADFTYSNPYYLHRDLIDNPEYRIRWADRIQRHLFETGALSPGAWNTRINRLAATIDQAIIAESARWGDAKSTTPFTKSHWQAAQASLLDYIAIRHPFVLEHLRADGLYPAIDAPVINPFGGYQASGVPVTMAGPAASTLYYMPDGSDPRAIGGALRPGARAFARDTATATFVPWSASGWRYLHDNSNQGSAWRAPGFDDSAWPSGSAKLGYGEGGEATVIPVPTPRYATAYFRKSFTVANPAEITDLVLQIEYDDGFAVYLNGSRIAGNLPIDPAYNYFSGTVIQPTTATVSRIPRTLLVAGTNVIAMEVHQANDTSPVLGMNASLTATRSTAISPLVLTGIGARPLRVRAYQDSSATWSAMSEAQFYLDTAAASPLNLAFGEIMYHPAESTAAEIAAGFADPEEFEFLEIVNPGGAAADLRGIYIDDAVRFDFAQSLLDQTLAPGERLLMVANPAAFAFRYGSGHAIAGGYSGHLANSGETITLRDADDSIIRQVSYSDSGAWPAEADGRGHSLVAITPADPGNDMLPGYWRASTASGGNPGTSDAILFPAWLAAHGQTDPHADPDGDGLDNLLEYALGGGPASDDRALALALAFQPLGTPLRSYPLLSHRQRRGADSVIVELENSADLSSWQTDDLPLSRTSHPDGTETVTHRAVEHTASATRHWWRLRASLRQ